MISAGVIALSFVLNVTPAVPASAGVRPATIPEAVPAGAAAAAPLGPDAVPASGPGSILWRTIAAAGRVEARAAAPTMEGWTPLRRNDEVAPSSHVRTFERSRTTLTRHGDVILVSARSEVVLPERRTDGGTAVLQTSGHAAYKVAPRAAGGRFEVLTPFLVAGVKGTRFSVLVEEGRAAVSVLEGVVEVRSALTGEAHDLTAGQIAIVDGRDGRVVLHRGGEGKEDRGRRREEANLRKDSSCQEGDSCAGADALLFEDVREESERLACSLETDTSLSGTDSDLDLWGDLDDDSMTLTRTTTGTLNDTTTRLDPTQQDVKTDTTLLDAVPLTRKKN